MEGFSYIVAPLTRFTRKDVPLQWSNECEVSFMKLKFLLTSAPILTLPIEVHEFMMYYDASDVGLGYVLMQQSKIIAYASNT